MVDLSIIIPTFDEEENVGPLYQALMDALPALGRTFEIIFVDDGSRDRTFERLAAIVQDVEDGPKIAKPRLARLHLERLAWIVNHP